MHGGEKVLGHGRLGQRKKLRFVEARLRALRFRIKLADGVNLVAEELDAYRAIGLGRVDIEDAAAPGELAWHLNEIHLRVADACQVRGEYFHVDLFAPANRNRKTRVVIAAEHPERSRLGRGYENGDGAGGQLPQGGGSLFLHIGVGRKILEREHVVRGNADDTRRINGACQFTTGAQRLLQGLCGLIVRNHNDNRVLGCAGQQWQVKGAAR